MQHNIVSQEQFGFMDYYIIKKILSYVTDAETFDNCLQIKELYPLLKKRIQKNIIKKIEWKQDKEDQYMDEFACCVFRTGILELYVEYNVLAIDDYLDYDIMTGLNRIDYCMGINKDFCFEYFEERSVI